MLKKTKEQLIVSFLVITLIVLAPFVASIRVLGVPAYPFPIEVRQADGSTITIQIRGDEWFNWTEDEDGYVIAYDMESGSWRYASIENGRIAPTGTEVGTSIVAFSRFSSERIRPIDLVPLFEQAERFEHSIVT